MAIIPRRIPERDALERCKIISHRGEHDNTHVMENTLEAFRVARDAGVWGVECDIRWTKDLVPVICHDPTPERVFAGHTQELATLTFEELRGQVPLIPSLEEVLTEFGGSTHLMLEIKSEAWPDQEQQKALLQAQLASLTPGEDYHFLALDPALFSRVDFMPPRYCFPVAEVNVSRLSRIALTEGFGGLGGHFLLLGNQLKARHEAQGQRLGTGFPTSKNALFRELNRGIEWVFSNDAVALQCVVKHHLNSPD